MFLSLLIGVVIYVPLRAIPILGWLVDAIITLIGLGAIWLYFRETTQSAVLPDLSLPSNNFQYKIYKVSSIAHLIFIQSLICYSRCVSSTNPTAPGPICDPITGDTSV